MAYTPDSKLLTWAIHSDQKADNRRKDSKQNGEEK